MYSVVGKASANQPMVVTGGLLSGVAVFFKSRGQALHLGKQVALGQIGKPCKHNGANSTTLLCMCGRNCCYHKSSNTAHTLHTDLT